MTARVLKSNDWYKVAPLFRGVFDEDLPPFGSTIIVLEEAGLIVGFTTLQPVMHMEPTWIHPDYRRHFESSKVLAEKVKLLVKQHKVVLCYTKDKRVGKLLKIFGWSHMQDWMCFRWLSGKKVA